MPRYCISIDVPRWVDNLIVWPVLLWRWFWYEHAYRRVKLLPDKYAKVDAKDFHEISKNIWWAKDNDGDFKAVRFLPGGNCGLPVYMHREIMKSKKGELIDHIDRDGLNNLRSNLRLATKSQNNMNRSGRKGTSSKYKGVSWFTRGGYWRAMIHFEGRYKFLGRFESEIDAAKAYDKAAKKYHGEFAYQNFSSDDKPKTRRAKIKSVALEIWDCSIKKTMAEKHKLSRVWIYFLATRPMFLTASAAPVLVGSALGFAFTGTFSVSFFLLALFATMLLHSGANIANDYFDHLSGNDPANKNPTPFSGGSRLIQQGRMSPKAALYEGIILLVAGGLLGIIIVVLTRSVFILSLGILGLFGGFFYTAGPVKLSYRTLGEITIAFLFGILPVAGSYYLQTGRVDYYVLPAAVIVSLLIFLIILINEFPDVGPDASVCKKTLVVRFGVKPCSVLHRAALTLTYLIAAASLFFDRYMLYATIAYFLTLPLGINVFMLASPKNLTETRDVHVNARTIILHSVGALALATGFVIYGLTVSRP